MSADKSDDASAAAAASAVEKLNIAGEGKDGSANAAAAAVLVDAAADAEAAELAAEEGEQEAAAAVDEPANQEVPVIPLLTPAPRSSLPAALAAELTAVAPALSSVWQTVAAQHLLVPLTGCRRPALFYSTVSGEDIYATFHNALPAEHQSVWHGCSRCRVFLTRFSNLCVIREIDEARAAEGDQVAPEKDAKDPHPDPLPRNLELVPLFWHSLVSSHPALPAAYKPAVDAVRALLAANQLEISHGFVPVAGAAAVAQPGGAGAGEGCTLGRGAANGAPLRADAAAGSEKAQERSYQHLSFTFPRDLCSADDESHEWPTREEMLAHIHYGIETVGTVYRWLSDRHLHYSDQHQPAIDMLLRLRRRDLYARLRSDDFAFNDRQSSLARWLSVSAGSSAGMISSVKSGMVSKLLEWCYAGIGLEDVNDKWNALANPEKYMRGTAPVSENQLGAAERIMKELGVTERDMRRRYLWREEIPKDVLIWGRKAEEGQQQEEPGEGEAAAAAAAAAAPAAAPKKSLFGAVPRKGEDAIAVAKRIGGGAEAEEEGPVMLHRRHISLRTFLSVLRSHSNKSIDDDTAPIRIEMSLPAKFLCLFLITAEPDTVPLMQWHEESNTNRASSYAWGELVQSRVKWGLPLEPKGKEIWREIHSILPFPSQWSDKQGSPPLFPQHGEKYLFAIEGASDCMGHPTSGCLFPAYLKGGKLHSIRFAIEAFNKTAVVGGIEELPKKGVAGIGMTPAVNGIKWTFRLSFKNKKKQIFVVQSDGAEGDASVDLEGATAEKEEEGAKPTTEETDDLDDLF